MVKKFTAVLMVLFFVGASAYADFNSLYTLVEVGAFSFAAPAGFYQIGDAWTNGKEQFTVEYYPGDVRETLNGSPSDILNAMNAEFGFAFGESWCGALYAEKGGGCYKIGAIVQEEAAEMFICAAACPVGVLVVLCVPSDTSTGMDLAHGIFKTISYVEYAQ